MLARTDSRGRALLLLIVATLIAGGVGTRLVWWQVVERDRLAGLALQQLARQEEIPAERGEITDANGVLLATSVELKSIYATPPSIEDPESTAALLAPMLGLSVDALRDRLDSDDPWVWVRRRVEPAVIDRVAALELRGIGMLPETKRVYPVTGVAPGTTLAAQVLGFVNTEGVGQYGIEASRDAQLAGLPGSVTAQEDVIGRQIADSIRQLRPPVDGSDLSLTLDAGLQHLLETTMYETYRRNAAKGVGQYGIEASRDAQLAGLPGSVTAQEDVIGRQIADSIRQLRPPVDGSDLSLTLDAGLQHLLETTMYETYRRNAAKGVTGLIMDVDTGAIRALATFPSFDANSYAVSDASLFTNAAVTRQYEPGSVMKAFTIAAALDAGAITTRDTFKDDNNLRLSGVRIQNADRYQHPYGHGKITAGEVLQLSNNVGAAKIGLSLGRQRLYEAFRRFGFGSPTGVDIAGEASGVVWNPDGPNGSGDLTAAQNAFGQGLSVTALQLAAGYAAIGNGGTLVTPHVVAGWTTPDGTYHPVEQPAGERVMRRQTSETVLKLLTSAVDDGIAQAASVPGYSIAGKTGTAQIAGPVTTRVRTGTDANGKAIYERVTRHRYIDGWIDSSFIGLMPASDPKLVTLILIHRPATWGLYQMAERPDALFRKLAPRVLDYLAIPPDRPQQPVAAG